MYNLFGRARFERTAAPGAQPQSSRHPGWPEATQTVQLLGKPATRQAVSVRLRPLLSSDAKDWIAMRLLDEHRLRPVEPTAKPDWESAHSMAAWADTFHYLRACAKKGELLPLAIEVDGNFAGQVSLGNVQHGAVSECWIGYWVFSQYQGMGVATAACALGVDHAFGRVGLHRVTGTYLSENPASGQVMKNVGFQQEGFLRKNLHIDGRWRDHYLMALNRDDFEGTAVARLRGLGKII